jgi:hypothetical protein
MIVPVTILVMLLYGFLMGLNVSWRTFFMVSFCMLVLFSVIAAMLNEAADPGDGTFFGTVVGSMLLLSMVGTLGILGFAVAHYSVKNKTASGDIEKGPSK